MTVKQQSSVFTQQGFVTVFDATVKHAGGPHSFPFARLHVHMDPKADSPHATKRKDDHVGYTNKLPDVGRTAMVELSSVSKKILKDGGIDHPIIFEGFYTHTPKVRPPKGKKRGRKEGSKVEKQEVGKVKSVEK